MSVEGDKISTLYESVYKIHKNFALYHKQRRNKGNKENKYKPRDEDFNERTKTLEIDSCLNVYCLVQ